MRKTIKITAAELRTAMAEVGCSESARLRVITRLFTPKQRGPKSSLDLAQIARYIERTTGTRQKLCYANYEGDL